MDLPWGYPCRTLNRPLNYKKNTRFSLPSQQSAFNTLLQPCKQWPLPPKPTPPITSHRSTPTTASSPSTRKSPISSTTNHTSSTLPLHPYCQTPPPPTKGSGKQSSSSSRRNVHESRRSSISSTWQTTTLLNSTPSSRTHPSMPTSTGENLTGDPRCNGNYRRHKMSHRPNDASATLSASHSNRHTGYNPRANKSNYNNNETPDITDLYGDEVYNNID